MTSTVRRTGSMRACAHKLRALYGLAGCYVERALAWQRGKTTIVGSKTAEVCSRARESYSKAKAHLRLAVEKGYCVPANEERLCRLGGLAGVTILRLLLGVDQSIGWPMPERPGKQIKGYRGGGGERGGAREAC